VIKCGSAAWPCVSSQHTRPVASPDSLRRVLGGGSSPQKPKRSEAATVRDLSASAL